MRNEVFFSRKNDKCWREREGESKIWLEQWKKVLVGENEIIRENL